MFAPHIKERNIIILQDHLSLDEKFQVQLEINPLLSTRSGVDFSNSRAKVIKTPLNLQLTSSVRTMSERDTEAPICFSTIFRDIDYSQIGCRFDIQHEELSAYFYSNKIETQGQLSVLFKQDPFKNLNIK